jgi:peptidoglycan/LPS O-acetylase OafA/YrhL
MTNRFNSLRPMQAALLASIFAIILAPSVFSQTNQSNWATPRGMQTPTPTPAPSAQAASVFIQARRAQKPIPLGWKITIVSTAFVLAAVVMAFAVRAWHLGNLFDREYRFPAVAGAAVRLGANKSGGRMATIAFGDREGLTSSNSTPEDS